MARTVRIHVHDFAGPAAAAAAQDVSQTDAGIPLYAARKLAAGFDAEIREWARSAGLGELVQDLHVTVCASRKAVPLSAVEGRPLHVVVPPLGRGLVVLGKTLALRLQSTHLDEDFRSYARKGATWDFPAFIPHMTLRKVPDGEALDLVNIRPFQGPLMLGAIEQNPLREYADESSD